MKEPRGIWYTPVTGIWQTVWIEPIEKTFISGLKIVPNIDGETVSVLAEIQGIISSDIIAVNVLGEYGGIGLVFSEHLWEENRNWGYVQYKTTEDATDVYVEFAEKLKKLIPFGYAAAAYIQTTDVEVEVNGLMTYDRKIIKFNEARIRKTNKEICNSLND